MFVSIGFYNGHNRGYYTAMLSQATPTFRILTAVFQIPTTKTGWPKNSISRYVVCLIVGFQYKVSIPPTSS